MGEYWPRFWNWLRGELHVIDVLFGTIGIWAWIHNSESAMKLDLNWLIQFYGVIRTALVVNKGIDRAADVKNYRTASELNSPPNEPPKEVVLNENSITGTHQDNG